MTQDRLQEAHQSDEPSEASYLEIRREKLGQISVRGWAVLPVLSTALVVFGPGATVYISAKSGFPTWAALIVVGAQIAAALVMMVVVRPGYWMKRQ